VIDETPGALAAEPSVGGSMIRLTSKDLFRGQREVVIVHRGTEYRLHITKADKLILTK
jgi:hemin uptake protein HemP